MQRVQALHSQQLAQIGAPSPQPSHEPSRCQQRLPTPCAPCRRHDAAANAAIVLQRHSVGDSAPPGGGGAGFRGVAGQGLQSFQTNAHKQASKFLSANGGTRQQSWLMHTVVSTGPTRCVHTTRGNAHTVVCVAWARPQGRDRPIALHARGRPVPRPVLCVPSSSQHSSPRLGRHERRRQRSSSVDGRAGRSGRPGRRGRSSLGRWRRAAAAG